MNTIAHSTSSHSKNPLSKRISFAVSTSVMSVLLSSCLFSAPRAEPINKNVQRAAEQSTKKPSLDNFSHTLSLDFSQVLDPKRDKTRFEHFWWKQNLAILKDGAIKISYPQWSFNPSSEPEGWAGFIYRLNEKLGSAKLSYDVKFDKNFDFVKGGKLPGFCSGECPRGGAEVEDGFSTRFMWRKNGDLELYAYIPGKKEMYGKSFGRWSFRLETGKYYRIEQIIKLNTPGINDGMMAILVDGVEVYRTEGVMFSANKTYIDSVLFSTFFGWNDPSWSATKDENVYFKNFSVSY